MSADEHTRVVRAGFAAALRGDLDALADVLAEDVRWHGAGGDPNSGCTNRQQALAWMRGVVAGGITAELLDVRALDEDRVLVLLQRQATDEAEIAPPHGQIVTFRGGKVSEILVYPSENAAIEAARDA